MQIEATEISNDATAAVATSLGRAAILPLLSGDVMGVVYCHYYDPTIANSALVFVLLLHRVPRVVYEQELRLSQMVVYR